MEVLAQPVDFLIELLVDVVDLAIELLAEVVDLAIEQDDLPPQAFDGFGSGMLNSGTGSQPWRLDRRLMTGFCRTGQSGSTRRPWLGIGAAGFVRRDDRGLQ
jgi:hypothetical protein